MFLFMALSNMSPTLSIVMCTVLLLIVFLSVLGPMFSFWIRRSLVLDSLGLRSVCEVGR